MSKTVVRFTTEPLTPEHHNELQRLFPGFLVIQHNHRPKVVQHWLRDFDSIAQDATVVEIEVNKDDPEIFKLIDGILTASNFCKRGGWLIRAIVDKNEPMEGDMQYEFHHYELIQKVSVVSQKIEPKVEAPAIEVDEIEENDLKEQLKELPADNNEEDNEDV